MPELPVVPVCYPARGMNRRSSPDLCEEPRTERVRSMPTDPAHTCATRHGHSTGIADELLAATEPGTSGKTSSRYLITPLHRSGLPRRTRQRPTPANAPDCPCAARGIGWWRQLSGWTPSLLRRRGRAYIEPFQRPALCRFAGPKCRTGSALHRTSNPGTIMSSTSGLVRRRH